MNVIDESTHLQLINLAAEYVRDKETESLRRPLNYEELAKLNKARDLVRAAKAQARAAGIIVESEVTNG